MRDCHLGFLIQPFTGLDVFIILRPKQLLGSSLYHRKFCHFAFLCRLGRFPYTAPDKNIDLGLHYTTTSLDPWLSFANWDVCLIPRPIKRSTWVYIIPPQVLMIGTSTLYHAQYVVDLGLPYTTASLVLDGPARTRSYDRMGERAPALSSLTQFSISVVFSNACKVIWYTTTIGFCLGFFLRASIANHDGV
jgi:hypothetical protein